MLRLRTQLRMLVLSAWDVPDGFTRLIAAGDDGTIQVILRHRGEVEGLLYRPCDPVLTRAWSVFADLDAMADRLVDVPPLPPETRAALGALDLQSMALENVVWRVAGRPAH